jgi:hypothetical protein
MGVIRRRFLSLAAAAAATPFALQLARPQVEVPSTSQVSHFVFPGAQWEAASPVGLGWSIQGLAEAYQLFATCPSSDDLRQFGCFQEGGSGSSVVEIKRHAGDAANDDLRWSGV